MLCSYDRVRCAAAVYRTPSAPPKPKPLLCGRLSWCARLTHTCQSDPIRCSGCHSSPDPPGHSECQQAAADIVVSCPNDGRLKGGRALAPSPCPSRSPSRCPSPSPSPSPSRCSSPSPLRCLPLSPSLLLSHPRSLPLTLAYSLSTSLPPSRPHTLSLTLAPSLSPSLPPSNPRSLPLTLAPGYPP